MAGLVDFLRNAVEQVAPGPLAVGTPSPDRETLSPGIKIIEQPNFLRFIALKDRSGSGAPPFSIVFDSFLIQRVTRQKSATFDVRYTTGSPVVDVFRDGVEMLSVNATIPDTEPFYTISGKPDPAAIARAQQNLALAQAGNPATVGAAVNQFAAELNPGIVTGYLGESMEALRAVYNRYFRASAASGSNQNIIGIVEFWSKGRVDRGYMIKLAYERTAAQLDHTDITFDMFVARSAFKNIKKPEVIV